LCVSTDITGGCRWRCVETSCDAGNILNVRSLWGPSWSWSYGSWIYNCLCNQCLLLLTWIRIPLRQGVLDTTISDKVCQWLATSRWFWKEQGTISQIITNLYSVLTIVVSKYA
jgi:hypothetical protein